MFGAPSLHIAGNVAEVLFSEGVMAELNERVGLEPGFKQRQGYVVPLDRLESLDAVCRELANRYDDADATYEGRTFILKKQTGANYKESTVVAAASGAELRTGLEGLRDLANRAANLGVAILADL